MREKRVFEIIQVGNDSDHISRFYDISLVMAIIINIFIAVFDTFPESEAYDSILNIIECITVVFFTMDYLLRIWTANYLYPYRSRSRARVKFIFSWPGIIDFLSCVPFFFPFFFPSGAVALRMFRIIRILRLFRIHNYSDPLRIISLVLIKKRGQLLSSIFIVITLMTAASLMMYSLEHDAQPEVFKNALSGFWWAINTLLTVGYGDIVPITAPGKICGAVVTFLGVGMVAIPTGILSAGFVEQISERKNHSKKAYCPHCGKKLD